MLTAKLFAGLASILTLIGFWPSFAPYRPFQYISNSSPPWRVWFLLFLTSLLHDGCSFRRLARYRSDSSAFQLARLVSRCTSILRCRAKLVLQAISSSRLPLASSSVVLFSQQMQHGLWFDWFAFVHTTDESRAPKQDFQAPAICSHGHLTVPRRLPECALALWPSTMGHNYGLGSTESAVN